MKAFTPEVASGNTSSSVKAPIAPSIANSPLKAPVSGVSGVQKTGSAASPRSQRTFTQPTHSYGNSTISATHEQRTGGVPHMPMLPGIQKIPKV